MHSLYINLPVKDLWKATAFYEAIGWVKNPAFSDDTASAVVLDGISLMLLTHEKWSGFFGDRDICDTSKAREVSNALSCESKEMVDELVKKALAAGGTAKPAYDHGFMYGQNIFDIDGHSWEIFWMNPGAMNG